MVKVQTTVSHMGHAKGLFVQGLDLVDVSADFNENLEKYTQLD